MTEYIVPINRQIQTPLSYLPDQTSYPHHIIHIPIATLYRVPHPPLQKYKRASLVLAQNKNTSLPQSSYPHNLPIPEIRMGSCKWSDSNLILQMIMILPTFIELKSHDSHTRHFPFRMEMEVTSKLESESKSGISGQPTRT